MLLCCMSTPQSFVELFLREKAASWARARPDLTTVYAKYFGEPLLKHVERFMPVDRVPIIEDVRQAGAVATVVTCEHFKFSKLPKRDRYRLAAVAESWKIVGIDYECYVCQGTGKSDGSRCEKCNGEGWYEPDRNE